MNKMFLVLCIVVAFTASFVSPWKSDYDAYSCNQFVNGPYLHSSVVMDRIHWQSFVAHIHTADRAMDTVSILPPWKGCGHGLATPAETALHSPGGCDVAVNAGFFDSTENSSHMCLGSLVSNGYYLKWSNDKNVVFGITEEQSPRFITGYLNSSDIAVFQWKQLVTGQGWLVRNGSSFLSRSLQVENFSLQQTGSADDFSAIKAPRSAVGYDQLGRFVHVSVDGAEEFWEGLTLDEFSQFLVGLGLQSAVNLDGGGSVSVFEGESLVNVPSDECPKAAYAHSRCPRPVASIFCIQGQRGKMTKCERIVCLESTMTAFVLVVILLCSFFFLASFAIRTRETYSRVGSTVAL